MPRTLLALPVLLLPAAAPAQEGPSFNCRDASTRTEMAICASPDLSRLERRMVASYDRLVAAIGPREARAIADELLARRQACEGDAACVAERLLISMEVFDQRAGVPGAAGTTAGTGRFARLDDLLRSLPARPPAAAPAAPAAAPPLAAPGADLPMAAQAPWPLEGSITDRDGQDPAGAGLSDALDDTLAGAELASSDGAAAPQVPAGDPDAQAPFDTPLSWAFMDLDRSQRQAIQERLAQADFLEGEARGTWTVATLAALQDFAEAEGSGSFDLSTQSGAALLLDYIASDAFVAAFGGEEAMATPAAAPAPVTPPAPVDTGDPLAGTDW